MDVWIDVVTNLIEVTALLGISLQFFQLRRDMAAMLRVIRRIDRKMATETV